MTVFALTTDRMVEGLRAVADFFESHPADVGGSWAVGVDAYNLTAEQMAEIARTPGTWVKGTAGMGEMFKLSRSFGAVTVAVYAERDEVCEARPTGRTTTIRKVVMPAVFEDVEVPELEWDCRPILGAVR